MIAEFDKELEYSAALSDKVRSNLQKENEKQKRKFNKLKQKYDREGIEHIEDEMDITKGGSG